MVQFISDTGAALAAAAIVAAFVWAANLLRNKRLEKQLAESIPTNGVSVAYDHNCRVKEFTIQLSNTSSATIRVRALVVMTDRFPILFRPCGSIATSQNPLDNAVMQDSFPTRVFTRGSIPDDEVEGSMIIPPLCLGIWKTSAEALGGREIKVSHAFIVFEYPNILGRTALVRVKVDGQRFALVKDKIEAANRNLFHGVIDPMIEEFQRSAVRG